jgi:serine/threonine protein kinase/WD40 repeat protein
MSPKARGSDIISGAKLKPKTMRGAIMDSSAEFQLLFGLLALQNNLISRQQLVAAFSEWIVNKQFPLSELLKQQGSLDQATAQLIHALAERHVEQHGGAVAESLAQLPIPADCREQLATLSDDDLQASLVQHGSLRPAAPQVESIHATLTVAHAPANDSSRFRFLRPHAEGGLGRVSVAFDQELHREVALKEIKERFADDIDSRSRFLREAEITGALEHPGIVPVYGLGQYRDGRPFYAMRMIRGTSLKVAIDKFHERRRGGDFKDEQVEFRRLLHRLVVVCDTLEFAHSRKVLHRDIKPGNIMLGRYGETLIVDWGLAKSLSTPAGGETNPDKPSATADTLSASKVELKQDSVHDTAEHGDSTWQPRGSSGSEPTQMGAAIGTPAFMSPEQAAGRLDRLSPATDVYSIGATLYYLLTGRVPFGETDVGSVLQKVQAGDFEPPRAIRSDIPPALEAICLRAMKIDPAERYESASALGRDLERYLADEPVAAHADTWQGKLSRWSRRHRSWLWAGVMTLGCVCVALAATAMITWYQHSLAQEHLRESLLQRASSLAGLQPDHPIGWRERTLNAMKNAVAIRKGTDLRNVALAALIGEDRTLLREFRTPLEVHSVAISADDRLCSFLSGEKVQFYRMQTGEWAFDVAGFESTPRCQVFLGDTGLLACGLQSGAVEMVDTKNGKIVFELRAPSSAQPLPCLAIAQGPEAGLLTTSDGVSVRVWDYGERKVVVEAACDPVTAPVEAAPAVGPAPAEAAPATGPAPAATDETPRERGSRNKPRTTFGSDTNKPADAIKDAEKRKLIAPPPPPPLSEPEPQKLELSTPPQVPNAPMHISLAVSLSQKRIAFGRPYSALHVWDYRAGTLKRIPDPPCYVQNRPRLAFVGNDQLFIAHDDGFDQTAFPPAPIPPAEAASPAGAGVRQSEKYQFISQPIEPIDPGPTQPLDPGQPLDPMGLPSDVPQFNALDAINRVIATLPGPAEASVSAELQLSVTNDPGQMLALGNVTCQMLHVGKKGQVNEPLVMPIGTLLDVLLLGDQVAVVTREGFVVGLDARSEPLISRWIWLLSPADITATCSASDSTEILFARRGREAQLWRRDAAMHKHVLLASGRSKCFLDWDPQEELLINVPWHMPARKLLMAERKTDWLPTRPGPVDGVEWRGDGQRLFVLSETGLVQAFARADLSPNAAEIAGQEHQLQLGEACRAWSVRLGPDNQLAVLANDGQVGLVRWSDDPVYEFNVGRAGDIIHAMSYSPDGSRLATGDNAAHVVIWSTATGQEIAEFPLDESVNAVEYSGDGKRLYAATSRPELVALDSTTGHQQFVTRLPSPGGQIAIGDQLIACGCLDGMIVICRRKTGEIVAQWKAHAHEVKRLKWSSSGSLITASSYGEVVKWNVTGLRKELAELELDWQDEEK